MKKILSILFVLIFACSLTFGASITDELKDMANQLVQVKAGKTKPSYAFVALTTDYKNTLVDNYVTDALTEAMFKTGKVKIIERANVEVILKEQKFQSSGLVNEENVKSIGMIAGADFVCYGTLKDLGASLTINARVVDVETGELCAIARTTILKDEYLQRQPQSAVGTPSIATTKTTMATTGSVVNNAWKVTKSVDEFGNCTYYTFMVNSTEQQFLFINYKRGNNPANSKVVAGIHWFINGWQDPTDLGYQTGQYEIKGKDGNIVTKNCKYYGSSSDTGVYRSDDAWNVSKFAYACDPKNSARWLVEIMKDSDSVAVRRDDMTRRFQTAGLLDKMAEYGITWEEIDNALANEEF